MGRFNKISAQLDKKFLDELIVDNKASCVEVHRDVRRIALHPYHLNDLNASISEILNYQITRYQKQLDGILLGYKNIRLSENEATIQDENCFLYVTIEADFYVFKPKVGRVLKAKVNKKSEDHVGALVHRVFNVSLPKTEENWLGDEVSVGDVVEIRVTKTILNSRLPFIKGIIINIVEAKKKSEIAQNKVTKFDDEGFEEPPKKHKKKKSKKEEDVPAKEDEAIDSSDEDQSESEVWKRKDAKKKRKKRKLSGNYDLSSNVEEDELQLNSVEESKESTKKNKKKRKRSYEKVDASVEAEDVEVRKKRKSC